MKPIVLLFLAALLQAATLHAAESVRISDPDDRQIVDAFLNHMKQAPGWVGADRCLTVATTKDEGIAWELCPILDMPLTAYRITDDPRYLDDFVAMFGNMRAALARGPDGSLGWYGWAAAYRTPEYPDYTWDDPVNSLQVTLRVAEFLEEVAKDPALAEKYADKRREYLDLIENDLVGKWQVREDRWADLGAEVGVFRMPVKITPTYSGATFPHNMNSKVLQGYLALYRVTGRDEYMRRAIKLGVRFKRCLKLRDGRYTWHYWDPAGPWDVHAANGDQWKLVYRPDHKSGYYDLNVKAAVLLYHHGVVFDETDMERFRKTQMEVCWNGDLVAPKYANTDGTPASAAYVSAWLAPFDPKLAVFCFEGDQRAARIRDAASTWQGGVMGGDWINMKFVYLPAAEGGRRIYPEAGERFLSKQENREFMESLEFTVEGAGYFPPATPRDLDRAGYSGGR